MNFVRADPGVCVQPDHLQLVTVAVFWEGKILLIYRKSEPFKGMYSIPGGHKEEGETYQQAACRELGEETSIQTDSLEPQSIFIDHDHRLECHGFGFVSKDGAFRSPVNEEQDIIGWEDLTDAVKLPLTPGLHESLQSFSSTFLGGSN